MRFLLVHISTLQAYEMQYLRIVEGKNKTRSLEFVENWTTWKKKDSCDGWDMYTGWTKPVAHKRIEKRPRGRTSGKNNVKRVFYSEDYQHLGGCQRPLAVLLESLYIIGWLRQSTKKKRRYIFLLLKISLLCKGHLTNKNQENQLSEVRL